MTQLFDELYQHRELAELRKSAPDAVAIAEAAETQVAKQIYSVFRRLAAATDKAADQAAYSSIEIMRALKDSGYDRLLEQAIDKLDPLFQAGGELVARKRMGKADLDLNFAFDLRNERTSQFLRSYKMDLIRQIVEDQQKAVNAAVMGGMMAGQPPKQIASQVKDVVGLTAWQGEQVQAYRAQLSILDPMVLRRGLRAHIFDKPISRAISSGTPLSEGAIDRYTQAYRDNWQRYRARTIARTETLRAANMGGRAAVQQRLQEEDLEGFDVVRIWSATDDHKTRDSHRSMDGQEVVGLDTPFTLPDGQPIRFPQDPDAPADETINCRCTIRYRMVPKTVPGGQAAF